jgi:hypothetical protein
LEKNCIFLKADCSFKEFTPNCEKFIKLTALDSSEGERRRCAGVLVLLVAFLDWKYLHRVPELRAKELQFEYLREFPTTDENEGVTL